MYRLFSLVAVGALMVSPSFAAAQQFSRYGTLLAPYTPSPLPYETLGRSDTSPRRACRAVRGDEANAACQRQHVVNQLMAVCSDPSHGAQTRCNNAWAILDRAAARLREQQTVTAVPKQP